MKATPAEAAISFGGKTVTVVVPSSPGAGTDLNARFWSQYFPKYLPGEPKMIVRNMPGGEALVAGNFVYSAKPDGLTVLASSGSIHLGALLDKPGVRYDPTKMPLAVAVGDGSVTHVKPGMIAKVEDLPNIKGVVAGFSPGGVGTLFVIAKEFMNIPTEKVVLAYSGSADSRRAYFAGEINLAGESSISFNQVMMPYLAKGEIMPIFQSGIIGEQGDLVRDPVLIAQIPTVKEVFEKIYGKPPSGLAWEAYLSMISANYNYKKGFFLSPGTPDNIVRAYWAAAEKMLKDTEFIKADELQGGKSALWAVGEAGDKAYKRDYKKDTRIIDWLKTTLEKYGVVL